jgi:integrase
VVRDHLVPELGNKLLAKLGPEDAQAFYAKKLGQGYAPRTVQYMHVTLHLALKYAVRWNLVPRNVTDVVNAPRIPRRDPRVLTVEQAQRLLAAARGDRMEALFVLALTSGMREGELLGLKWEDIDLTCGALSVRRTVVQLPPPFGWIESEPKSVQSRRSIKLAAVTISALHAHRARQLEQRVAAEEAWEDHDLVFPTTNGRWMSPTTLRVCHFRPLLRRAGIPYMRFHDLRHGAATLLLSMGIHPKVVQELLGHSQISITMDIYSHVLLTLQGEAVRRLGELLEGSE